MVEFVMEGDVDLIDVALDWEIDGIVLRSCSEA